MSSSNEFIHGLHQSIDLADTTKTIANETRRWLDCDRVSVLRVKGKRCKVMAVSGQPSVNRRSNTVRLLTNVAEKVLPTGQVFWHPDENELPPQIENPLSEYLGVAATRTLVVAPIFDQPDSTDMQVDQHREDKKLVGGIVIEHCREQLSKSEFSPRVETAVRHSCNAYRSSWQHQNLFLYSVWKWLGKSKIIFAARHLPKTIAAAAGLIALGLILTFVPSDFEMSCDGQLVPIERQRIFPRRPGVVTEVHVDHAQQVSAGDPLVSLTDLELDYRIAEAEGRIDEIRQTVRSSKSGRLNRDKDDSSAIQKESLLAQQAELLSLENQLKVLAKRKSELTVTSPLSGHVMTWDVRDKLKSRPVTVTNQLMEIANVDGKWQLELDLPDRKVGHFLEHWNRSREKDEQVAVDFILAADPSTTHTGHVESIGTTTAMNGEHEHHLKIKVKIDIEGIDVRQSRSGVSAKIHCGTESLGYSWLHPVLEFFQSKVIFPIW